MCRTPDDVKFAGRAKPETEDAQLARWKANRKLWVEALRGGAYEQGTEQLRSADDRFCCLGVLADIAGCVWNQEFQADGEYGTAPLRAKDFVGLIEANGEYTDYRGETQMLSRMNDDGKTFAEIADLIEQEPEGLFLSRSDS